MDQLLVVAKAGLEAREKRKHSISIIVLISWQLLAQYHLITPGGDWTLSLWQYGNNMTCQT